MKAGIGQRRIAAGLLGVVLTVCAATARAADTANGAVIPTVAPAVAETANGDNDDTRNHKEGTLIPSALSADERARVKGESVSADTALEAVTTEGFVDTDGAKLKAIILTYDRPIMTASLHPDTYDVTTYDGTLRDDELTQGSGAGTVRAVYANTEPTLSATGGTTQGRYVIIEMATAYQRGRFPRSWQIPLAADVRQVKPVLSLTGVIRPATQAKGNGESHTYVPYDPQTGKDRPAEVYSYAKEGTYAIAGIEDYKLHTLENGTAFKATHCFDEANGRYWDFSLPYALYVPRDYDPHKKYGLVLHLHDAGSMSSDPRLTLTESQAAANYASPMFQEAAKAQGLDGVIVVCPAIAEFFPMDAEHPRYELRMARDNWTTSCAVPAVWELLDFITAHYAIDTDRIYGSGQSMGGMALMAMAAQRDNYFAGLLIMSSKWGTNYDKAYPVDGRRYYAAPADGQIIYTVDDEGRPCDYNNWFYMISDDNILFLNTVGENDEYRFIYKDLCKVRIPKAKLDVTDSTAAERNQVVRDLANEPNDTGIWQVLLQGKVSHMSAWFYGHGTPACYEWLLRQQRRTEQERAKLPLQKTYERAAVQKDTKNRIFAYGQGGTPIYYPTGRYGSGTADYNSGIRMLGSDTVLAPGRSTSLPLYRPGEAVSF